MNDVLLIAGCRNPVVADYADHCVRDGRTHIAVAATQDVCEQVQSPAALFPISNDHQSMLLDLPRVKSVVIFIEDRLTTKELAALATVVRIAKNKGAEQYCVVSSFEVHLGNQRAIRAEDIIMRQLENFCGEVVVFRTGHIVSPRSRLGRMMKRWWFAFPLVPSRLGCCCLDSEELFAAIDSELTTSHPRARRTYALLGPNKPWRERLLEIGTGRLSRIYASIAFLLFPLTLFRGVMGVIYSLLARKSRQLQSWHHKTLFPNSTKEVLTLYNKYNYKYIQIVGYNNGAVHFGQRYPGKTVVSMLRCARRALVQDDTAEFDAGVTIRQARDVLEKHERELPVLPNYSYVALGTSYFIPIHGSASDFSTIAETIQKVLLFDPIQERFLAARRNDTAFGAYLYNLNAHILLLRLQVQTKRKTRYYVKQFQSSQSTGKEILGYFADPLPSNVEIRKAGSKAESIKVYQYFTENNEKNGPALDVPRDALGRLWDRLEENCVSSVLFHGLNRLLAYHVELFLTKEDFVTFWSTHGDLHLLKIQLRFIKRDGFPNSPFRDQDCISADLFMLKKHRQTFDSYLRTTIPAVKLNPGKHTN